MKIYVKNVNNQLEMQYRIRYIYFQSKLMDVLLKNDAAIVFQKLQREFRINAT